jgi:AcrR family transcriptional regulator
VDEETTIVRVKTEARREAFLAAAKEVFREASFDQASMADIAARVGSSKATLYRYFDSKEALFLELVRRSASEHGGHVLSFLHPRGGAATGAELPAEAMDALALLDPGEDVASTLTNFGQRILKTFHTPQTLAVTRMVIAAAGDPKVGRIYYEQGPARGMKHLERYFARVIEAGRLRPSDAQVVACHFRALLEAEVREAGLFNVVTQLDDERIVAIVARAVDVFMRAYGCTTAV